MHTEAGYRELMSRRYDKRLPLAREDCVAAKWELCHPRALIGRPSHIALRMLYVVKYAIRTLSVSGFGPDWLDQGMIDSPGRMPTLAQPHRQTKLRTNILVCTTLSDPEVHLHQRYPPRPTAHVPGPREAANYNSAVRHSPQSSPWVRLDRHGAVIRSTKLTLWQHAGTCSFGR